MASFQKREQACHRYYQPWLAAHGSAQTVARQIERLARLGPQQERWEPLEMRDQTLIAIAQNVVLRLGLRRCLISLIDEKYQYVIAEATESCSSRHPNGKKGDEIWLGNAILSRPDAMCEHCLDGMCLTQEEDGSSFGSGGMIINDCRLNATFADKPYVMQEDATTVRFYAGVPLVSPDGYRVGVLAVTDENPRNGLTAEELRWMEDMAACAMDHLEWAVDRVDRFKSERVVRGMANFVDETSHLSDISFVDYPTSADTSSREKSFKNAPGDKSLKSAQAEHYEEIAAKVAANETSMDETSQDADVLEVSDVTNSSMDKEQIAAAKEEDATIRVDAAAGTQNAADATAAATTADSSKEPSRDAMITIYATAAHILRDCTLADGCVIYGASASMDRSSAHGDSIQRDEQGDSKTASPDDSATMLSCKLLAHAGGLHESTITVEALGRLATMFPHGHIFEWSNDDTDSTPSPPPPPARERSSELNSIISPQNETLSDELRYASAISCKQVLDCFPGAKTTVFLPLFDHLEDKLAAGVFIWTSVSGRMALEAGLSHLRAFSHCIEREIMRFNMQRNEAAKTTFIASMSHELRSPLHGILGAAEFLADACQSAYEHGLVTSITLCGKQLLDTLNHVLDYSKINSLEARRKKSRIAPDSSNATTEAVDLSALVEESSEAITIGHSFKTVTQLGLGAAEAANAAEDILSAPAASPSTTGGITTLLDIQPGQKWAVIASPGALQRIIMNLLGNALKFTESGFVSLSLRATGEPDVEGKLDVLIRVVDSGVGISETFQRRRLFTPFTQEDSFATGTGLGLSIVKQIVNTLGGSIQIKSQKHIGTEVDVRLRLLVSAPVSMHEARNLMLENCFTSSANLDTIVEKTRGKRLVLLDPLDARRSRSPTHPASRFQQNLRETCERWFDMRVTRAESMTKAPSDVSIYLYGEPPPIEMLRLHKSDWSQQPIPVILACQNNRDAIDVVRNQQTFLHELGEIVEVMQQPCGPRKLASMLMQCFRRSEEAHGLCDSTSKNAQQSDEATRGVLKKTTTGLSAEKLSKSVSAAVALPTGEPSIDPLTPGFDEMRLGDRSLDLLASPLVHPKDTPVQQDQASARTNPDKLHGLIVDDNKINRQLLVMFMKKSNHTYSEAENGQEAVDEVVRASAVHGKSFDIIFMDISMPVMDGLQATRAIRRHEREASLKRTKIIALTGLGSIQAREDAEAAGVDLFLAKPVKFAELKKLLRR